MSTTRSARTWRSAGLAVLFCLSLLIIAYTSQHKEQRPRWLTSRPTIPSVRKQPRCSNAPDPGNIAIAVKTGATEAVNKIPMLMQTALKCAENVMFFSDLEQDIAGHHLHDALKDIPQSVMEGNSDFDFYHRLREAHRLGQIEAMLGKAKDPRVPQDLAAWTLDKYKQLHILEDLYAAHPDKDWYYLIDADTYVIWANLLAWLLQLPNPRTTPLYLGAPAVVGDREFAHGGSGILLSHATMHKLAVERAGIASEWDQPMHDECCGDLVIGTVLKDIDVRLQPSWPTVNGETPLTLPFGPSHWCQPVVTMHHVQPHEMNQLANFELSRNSSKDPLRFADLYNTFVKPALMESMHPWDNNCQDVHIDLSTYEDCRSACENDHECFQFQHKDDECKLGHSIRLGHSETTSDDPNWHSGWLNDRINTWVDRQGPCGVAEFPWTR